MMEVIRGIDRKMNMSKKTFQARHGSGGFNRHIIETPFYSIQQFELRIIYKNLQIQIN